ncbi:hypothetical protein BLX41_01395 [Pseudomonas protegens]|uniref:hypothetical protein n=1 Tax=Pseudomonas protegens TaxID=380021 RepID=UPI000F4CC8EB|nr:hypothetical protein [Pseudomonas protegens]ROL83231.1 hypothetical protein BLX41_01395 [Pseudomonas protegens]
MTVLRPGPTRHLLQLTAAIVLGGCASHGADQPSDIRTEDAKAAEAVLELQVSFAKAPDYKPETSGPYAYSQYVKIEGAPTLQIPFYQKGIGFELGVVGDPRALLALPYPSPKADSASNTLRVVGQQLDSTHYRFVVLPLSGWNSLDSFEVAFAHNGRREAMTFTYSTQVACNSSFAVTTPTYGFALSVAARFPKGVSGCLKACDARPGYAGQCAYNSGFRQVSNL